MTDTQLSNGDLVARGDVLPFKIISVDDHVLEPPDLWTERIPKKYSDRVPRVVRERGTSLIGRDVGWTPDPDGALWADVWYYDDLIKPLVTVFAAVGTPLDQVEYDVTTFDEIRSGCWKQKDRLADMDVNETQASLCFPNTLPRFCGQTFAERKDKQFALMCLQAYNDWLIEEWCAGDGRGRLLPVALVPLWDVQLASAEVRRSAERGCCAVTFSENPEALGFPSVYTGYWDSFFAACEETKTTVCIHIGSSSRMATTTSDAPSVAASTLTFQYGMHSLIDMIFSGTMMRFPDLKIAYSECNVGWMPYVLERMDKIWKGRGDGTFFGHTGLDRAPSSFLPGRIYGCIVDDESGLAARDRVGMSQICYEVDYPHADSLFPRSPESVLSLASGAGLSDTELYQFIRGNAIDAFGLTRFGIVH